MNQNTKYLGVMNQTSLPNEKCVCMKIFALGDQGNLSKGIDNKIIKALTKQAGHYHWIARLFKIAGPATPSSHSHI